MTLLHIRRKIAKQFNFLLKFTEKGSYCAIFNMIRQFSGDTGRISYDSSSDTYIAHGERYTIHYCQKNRSRFYKYGPEHRVKKLSHEYFYDSIEFSDGDLVIECGANIGELFFYFNEAEKNVEYYGFEPAPAEFQCLCLNTGKTMFDVGLYEADTTLTFYLASASADSSLFQPNQYESTTQVRVKRLDGLFPDRKIKLLKIEAEGGEPEVVYGCENILRNIEYISADLGFERGIHEESTFIPVTNYLLKNGFELILFNNRKIKALFRNTNLK